MISLYRHVKLGLSFMCSKLLLRFGEEERFNYNCDTTKQQLTVVAFEFYVVPIYLVYECL